MYVCIGLVLAGTISCLNGYNPKSPKSNVDDDGISIFNGDPDSSVFQSYQAQVRHFYTNSRTGIVMEPRGDYRLSLKVIDDNTYTRIDLDRTALPDARPRTIISDNTETVVFYSDTSQIISRFPVDETVKKFQLPGADLTAVGKVNLDAVKAVSNRLSFDVSTSVPGMFEVNIPSHFFPISSTGTGYSSRVRSSRVQFDSAREVMVSSEMVIEESNGTMVTVSLYPMYTEHNDIIVKTGQVMTVSKQFPYTIDASDSVVETYHSLEEIPVITPAELKELQDRGLATEGSVSIIIGDQGNPNYVESHVTQYNDIQLNTLPDSFFRTPF